MSTASHQADMNILEWYLEQGVTEVLEAGPVNRLALVAEPQPQSPVIMASMARPSVAAGIPEMPLGTADARKEAVRLALEAGTLAGLEAAIRSFDGLALKKTATNMVFGDGNPKARLMIVGEAPGGEEDKEGKPFAGAHLAMLDKMLAAIGLDRQSEDPAKSVYITSILNWRPPGNRSASAAEIEVSLPFIERHIALVKPAVILFMGNVPSKALLNVTDDVKKLRGGFRNYAALTEAGGENIPALATFHPSFLLKTPLQKKAAWSDLLLLAEKLADYTSK